MADKALNIRTRNMSKSSDDNSEPSLVSIDKKLNSILSALEVTNNDIKSIRKEQSELATSVELCHSNIQDLVSTLKTQDEKIEGCSSEVDSLKNVNVTLSSRLNSVEQQLHDSEQYSHRNNLIVYGIPEDRNENILRVINRLAVTMNVEDWSDSLVDAAHRMGLRENNSRPIIIKFVSRLDRDRFLQKRKVKRNLRASDLGYASDTSVYVNESLTSHYRKLLQNTRDVAKNRGYQFVWTFNCAIYVRKSTGVPSKKILRESDLENL